MCRDEQSQKLYVLYVIRFCVCVCSWMHACDLVPYCPPHTKSSCTADCCTDWRVISAPACMLPTKLLCVHKFTAGVFFNTKAVIYYACCLCTHDAYVSSCYFTCECVNLRSVIDKTVTDVNNLFSLSHCVFPFTHAHLDVNHN